MDEYEPYCTQKVVLLGASDVGKSSLVLRFVKGKFFERRENTIGAAFLTKTISVGGKDLKYEIWDTAGQERYHSLAPMYYRDAAGALIVYDITDKDSLDKAKRWLNELYSAGRTDMVISFVGNKCDLSDNRQVEVEEASGYAKEQQLAYYETSAKEGTNINELFEEMGAKLLAQFEKASEDEPKPETIKVQKQYHVPSPDEKTCPC
mmetsp:Transcript_17532/g.22294  ORF Transcript_17532/g.22294 Transcript_17532/m.22294 type:complete len:206 (-) Transcript_17532:90-707(-)